MPTENKKKSEEKNDPVIPEPSPQYQVSDQENEPSDFQEKEKPVEQNDNSPLEDINIPNNSDPVQPLPLSAIEERTWAMLAHLSILLNLFTGFFGGVAAILIYFIYKDRSRYVAYHAMQSFIFQSITWLGAGLVSGFLISVGSIFGFLIIPLLCLIPGFLILLLIPASLIYGIVGAVQTNNGEDFRYWQVGDWVREILEPRTIN